MVVHIESFQNEYTALHIAPLHTCTPTSYRLHISAFTSFLPKRPPKRERDRFLGFSGPKKSGERKAEGSGLRDARTADPLLQQVCLHGPASVISLVLSMLGKHYKITVSSLNDSP